MACLPNKPMSYLLFKLNLEMAYVSTFERDTWVQEQYDKYLSDFYITQKKREGLLTGGGDYFLQGSRKNWTLEILEKYFKKIFLQLSQTLIISKL